MFSLASLIIFNFKSIMYICSHMLCVPILHECLLSVSVYSCVIFIWEMKQTDVEEGCNFEVITFDYIYPSIFSKKHILKMSAKCAQQSMILAY